MNTPGHIELDEAQQQLIAEADVLEHSLKKFVEKVRGLQGPDPRNMSLAVTHGEDCFMRIRRAITTGRTPFTQRETQE